MRRFLDNRERARQERARARASAMSEALPELCAILFEEGAARTWVFGSFVAGQIDEHSDLDIAVAGLPAARFIPARVRLSAVCPVPFDLVEIERAPESLRDEIRAHGRELFPVQGAQ